MARVVAGFKRKAGHDEAARGSRDASVVRSWPADVLHGLRGFQAGDLAPREWDAAKACLHRYSKVSCRFCGVLMPAHLTNVRDHSSTAKCKKSRESGVSNPILWIAEMVAMPQVESASLGEAAGWAAAIAEVHGVSPAALEALLGRGSPFLEFLLANGDAGMPSRKVLAAMKGEATAVLQSKNDAVLRDALQTGAICVMVDESSVSSFGGLYVTNFSFYAATVRAPVCLEVVGTRKAHTADGVTKMVHDTFVRDGRLTEEEFDTTVLSMSGDHAAYMEKAAEDAKLNPTGDGPHALHLAMEKAARAFPRVLLLAKAVRRLLTSRSIATRQLLEAFGINRSEFKESMTRWTRQHKMLNYIVPKKMWCAVQQCALAIQGAGGGAGAGMADGDDSDDVSDGDDAAEVSVAELMADATVYAEVRALVALQVPLATAITVMQTLDVTSIVTGEVLSALEAITRDITEFHDADRATLLDLVGGMDNNPLGPLAEAAKLAVSMPLGPQYDVTRAEDGSVSISLKEAFAGGARIAYHTLPPPGKATVTPLAAAKAALSARVSEGANQIAVSWNKWAGRVYRVALNRSIAGALARDAVGALDATALTDALEEDEALPRKLMFAEEEDDEERPTRERHCSRIKKQHEEFKKLVTGHALWPQRPTTAETALPGRFWLRMKQGGKWPQLTATMLFWLSAPISTASLERSFSFLTMLTKELRRGAMTPETAISNMYLRMHREDVETGLRTALRASRGKRARVEGGDGDEGAAGGAGGAVE